jgi:hypothetical protein
MHFLSLSDFFCFLCFGEFIYIYSFLYLLFKFFRNSYILPNDSVPPVFYSRVQKSKSSEFSISCWQTFQNCTFGDSLTRLRLHESKSREVKRLTSPSELDLLWNSWIQLSLQNESALNESLSMNVFRMWGIAFYIYLTNRNQTKTVKMMPRPTWVHCLEVIFKRGIHRPYLLD